MISILTWEEKGNILEGGEEKDLFKRIKQAGLKIFYAPNVVVDHIIPSKRLETDYIKRQGIGVGVSEKKKDLYRKLYIKIQSTNRRIIQNCSYFYIEFYVLDHIEISEIMDVNPVQILGN